MNMPFNTQYGLNFRQEINVDLFAGGGGASTGIEIGTGRRVDVGINHNAKAISMFKRHGLFSLPHYG